MLNNVTTAMPYTVGSLNVTFSGLYGKDNGVDAYYNVLKLKPPMVFSRNDAELVINCLEQNFRKLN